MEEISCPRSAEYVYMHTCCRSACTEVIQEGMQCMQHASILNVNMRSRVSKGAVSKSMSRTHSKLVSM